MTTLQFKSSAGDFCQINLAEPLLPKAIAAQLKTGVDVFFDVEGLEFDSEKSDIQSPGTMPLFFEWQRLDWFFEPSEYTQAVLPLSLYVNDNLENGVKFSQSSGRCRLNGNVSLGNAVGKTRFTVKDATGKCLFSLGAEVFPQKLDYKDDFPAMMAEITEIVYSLAFDVFRKTFASTKTRSTYHQTLSEWLNLYKALAESFEQSLNAIIRSPKSELKRESKIKPVDRVKRASHKSITQALKKPDRYCRGEGIDLGNGFQFSHLREEHKRVSYDTPENRFVLWASKDVMKRIDQLLAELKKRESITPKRIDAEKKLLYSYQRKLRFRIQEQFFREVGEFSNQQQFSTTLTMAPGYKEFYHRYLLLRKGLTLADDALFSMDYKDIATLYEYWCFLKTVKLLRDSPKYDLTDTDIVRIEHQKFAVNLKKGYKSGVHFKQHSTGDSISLFYNRSFSKDNYTHTFNQIPDNFIEFSREGFGNKKDKKTFKVVLDAKYRFDRGSADYPDVKIPYGPPLDAIAQLHRYRDAILWQQDSDDSVKLANKSVGGVILFPYPNDEMEFVEHPFYQSIDKVNIGAVPLQPGEHRNNKLYQLYLDSLFEVSGESLNEKRIRFDAREYNDRKRSQSDLVMVGMIPNNHREARLDFHFKKLRFYTQWSKESKFPLDKVSAIALYDQQSGNLIGYADVNSIEFALGKELKALGTSWPARKPDAKHCVYELGKITKINLPASGLMSSHRNGRYFVSRLGLDLALKHENTNLFYLNSWERYTQWKNLKAKCKTEISDNYLEKLRAQGADISKLSFITDNEE